MNIQIGSKVILNNYFIEDEDLLDFLEENDVKHVLVTEIEGKNFWGVTDKKVEIPYHLELKYVWNIL